MKKHTLIIPLLAASVLSGCFTKKNLENPDHLSATEALSTLGGAALGAGAAYSVSDGDGVETALGGIAGGATGYGVSNYYKGHAVTEYQYNQEAKRNAPMVEEFEDQWDSKVQTPINNSQTRQGNMAKYLNPVNYPAGVYEGVHYHSRSVDPLHPYTLNPIR